VRETTDVRDRWSTWPAIRATLRGALPVRVENPSDVTVRVGIRTKDGDGCDFVVGPRGEGSASVPDGRYDVYLQYSSEPAALYQGDPVDLRGFGVRIRLVQVVGGNYGTKRVK
jgi:hypothetical protein